MTSESMHAQVEAAVKLESRLTSIEATQQAIHVSADRQIGAIGELKGFIEGRFAKLESHYERLETRIAAQERDSELHLTEVRTRRVFERQDDVEKRVARLESERAIEAREEQAREGVWRSQYGWLIGGVSLASGVIGLAGFLTGRI